MLKAFAHQKATTAFIQKNPKCLITSDPGTGKTRSVLDAYIQGKEDKGRLLVLAPLSILQASWGEDILKFTNGLEYEIAYARNRQKAFESDTPVVITNHDAVKWLLKNQVHLKDFNTICIDEFTAFKNKDSQRSKALAKIVSNFKYRIGMSGTPNSNTILDIWHPCYVIDDGKRLGPKFYTFRSNVCTSRYNGFANEWVDKSNAEALVATAIKDINIRYKLEECLDMPPTSRRFVYTTLHKDIQLEYDTFEEESVLYTEESTINAVHAGAKVKKLLQLCTGAIYDEFGNVIKIHKERYDMVMSLIVERRHSLVAFNWRHEREQLVALAEKQKIKYAVIDGQTPSNKRADIVERFQAGQLQCIFAHPQSTSHGLTLTKANTVIWSSPTYNAEHFQQFNRRIYRAGQTKRTEVICIAARHTWETEVYKKLEKKLTRMEDLLGTLNTLRKKHGRTNRQIQKT